MYITLFLERQRKDEIAAERKRVLSVIIEMEADECKN